MLHKLYGKLLEIFLFNLLVTLQLYASEGRAFKKKTCARQDTFYAKNIAAQFGFSHYVINLEKTFEKYVMEDFVDSYLRGKTQIPCVKCNHTEV